MTCKRCGTEFSEGMFCPVCGAKNEEVNIDKENIDEIEKRKAQHEEAERKEKEEKRINRKAIISLVLGIATWVAMITVVIPIVGGIWAIVDGCIALRGKTKYKKSAIFGILLPILFYALLIIICVQDVRAGIKREEQLNSYIENQQYEEAQEFIAREYAVGTLSYVEKSAQLYEMQEMYDEAVDLWVEYCSNEYKSIDIPDSRINMLNEYIDKYKDFLRTETIERAQKLIDSKEEAKRAEEEAKRAEEAAKRAEEEADKLDKQEVESVNGSNSETDKKNKDIEEEERTSEISIDAYPDSKKYLHLGGRYKSQDGFIEMNIVDINTRVIEVDDYVGTHIYFIVEFTNNRNEDIYFDQSDVLLFIDDYEVSKGIASVTASENGYCFDGNNVSYPTAANIRGGGRKGKILFTVCVEKKAVKENSEIDVEINGGVFKVNPLFILNANKIDKSVESSNSDDGIGNPIIDANPDRYVLTDGYIEPIDDGFYADSGNINLIPGQYYITGGANAMLFITEDTISMTGGKNNFENAEIKPAENMSPHYWVYVDGNYYAAVSFFEGGLYFRTLEADGEDDWDEGFYMFMS